MSTIISSRKEFFSNPGVYTHFKTKIGKVHFLKCERVTAAANPIFIIKMSSMLPQASILAGFDCPKMGVVVSQNRNEYGELLMTFFPYKIPSIFFSKKIEGESKYSENDLQVIFSAKFFSKPDRASMMALNPDLDKYALSEQTKEEMFLGGANCSDLMGLCMTELVSESIYTVLDLGCGTGLVLEWLVGFQDYIKVNCVGVDSFSLALDKAQDSLLKLGGLTSFENNPSSISPGFQGAKLIQGDLTQLPIEKESFDVVICQDTIPYICKDAISLLKKVFIGLKNDGYFCGSYFEMTQEYEKTITANLMKYHGASFWSPDEFYSLMKLSGFTVMSCQSYSAIQPSFLEKEIQYSQVRFVAKKNLN